MGSVQGDVEGLSGALTRLELLEEARNVWEDAMLTEAARRGELAGKVNRLQMELEALRRDGVSRQLHASDGIRDAIRDAIKEGALLDAFDEMKEGIRQEITPMLKRVQGLEVHSQTSIVKIDQRLANLEACSGKVGVGGLGWVEKELGKVKLMAEVVGDKVFGSKATQGARVVLGGLAKEELNGEKGTLIGWNKGRERWEVRVGDEVLLIKEDKIFMADGLASRLWCMWRAVFEGRERGSMMEASSDELGDMASGWRGPIAPGSVLAGLQQAHREGSARRRL